MYEILPPDTTITLMIAIGLVGFMAGLIKGVVGFAMPMVWITGLTIFVAPDMALALLILPTLVTNGWQSMRQGHTAALQSIRNHKRFLTIVSVILILTTQIVPYIPVQMFFLILGVIVIVFSTVLLLGWQPTARQRRPLQNGLACVAGIAGGISGILGPPTVAYLNTMQMDRQDYMRIQGIVYGTSAVLLMVGHITSGILTAPRLMLALFTLPTALLGIWVGFYIQDRINQRSFRLATLIVLLLAGANLIRRGMMGS